MKWSIEDYKNVLRAFFTAQLRPTKKLQQQTFDKWKKIVRPDYRKYLDADKFDKRDALPFFILRMPHTDSNICLVFFMALSFQNIYFLLSRPEYNICFSLNNRQKRPIRERENEIYVNSGKLKRERSSWDTS